MVLLLPVPLYVKDIKPMHVQIHCTTFSQWRSFRFVISLTSFKFNDCPVEDLLSTHSYCGFTCSSAQIQ